MRHDQKDVPGLLQARMSFTLERVANLSGKPVVKLLLFFFFSFAPRGRFCFPLDHTPSAAVKEKKPLKL